MKVEKARFKLQTATEAVKERERRLQQARALSEHEEGDKTQQVPDDLAELLAISELAEKFAEEHEHDKLRAKSGLRLRGEGTSAPRTS